MKKPSTCRKCGHPLVCLPCERDTRNETAADLRAARERAGIGLREMARRLGVTASSLNRLEAGAFPGHELRLRVLAEIAKGKAK